MKATRTATVPSQRLSGEFMRHVAAAGLLAFIVASVIGAALLMGVEAPYALLTGVIVGALVKLDDARIRRARRRVTA